MENYNIIKKGESGLNRALRISSIIVIVAILTDTILSLKDLPNLVPIHFGVNGEIDGYASGKGAILLFIGIGIIMCIFCNIVAIYPKRFLKNSKLTESNKEKQYSLFSKFNRVLGLEIAVFFGYMQYEITRAALNGAETIEIQPFIFIALIIGASYIIYEAKSKRLK